MSCLSPPRSCWLIAVIFLLLAYVRVTMVGMECVKPTSESIFGNVVDLDVQAAANLANDRIEWKKNRPSATPIRESTICDTAQ